MQAVVTTHYTEYSLASEIALVYTYLRICATVMITTSDGADLYDDDYCSYYTYYACRLFTNYCIKVESHSMW